MTDVQAEVLLALAERCEKATGPDDAIDMAIVEAAFKGKWPLACYGGEPINYDPGMWMERYGFSPTSSLDDAMSLVPQGLSMRLFIHPDEAHADIFRLHPSKGMVSEAEHASTAPLAICAAALRALAERGK